MKFTEEGMGGAFVSLVTYLDDYQILVSAFGGGPPQEGDEYVVGFYKKEDDEYSDSVAMRKIFKDYNISSAIQNIKDMHYISKCCDDKYTRDMVNAFISAFDLKASPRNLKILSGIVDRIYSDGFEDGITEGNSNRTEV